MKSKSGEEVDVAGGPQMSVSPVIEEQGSFQAEEEEEDDDPGMFSYLPPTPHSPAVHSTNASQPTDSSEHLRSSPPTSFLASSTPSTPPPRHNSVLAAHLDLSPAAAYALSSRAAYNTGPRKRGSWTYPSSPTSDGQAGNGGRATDTVSLSGRDGLLKGGSDDAMSSVGFKSSRDQWGGSDASLKDNFDLDGLPLRVIHRHSDKVDGSGTLPIFAAYLDEEEDSPFPEVRASVSNIDDPEMPCLTFRTWVIGGLLSGCLGGVNLFFMFRYPAPIITPIMVQVVAYPFGKFLAATLPTRTVPVPSWLQRCGIGFGEECSLNPGPFNIKEHTVIIIMSNLALAQSFSLNFNLANELFYNRPDYGTGFDIVLTLTANMTGFGLSGLCRRFLVWPASMIWPQNLVFCTLLNTLHAEEDDGEDGKGVSRFKFFMYAATAAFFWYFIPGFLFQALSAFSFICWAAPNNVVVNQLFGVGSGLGMGMLTFDWSQIAYIGSPLIMPFWAEVNSIVGFVIVFWIAAPILYFTNVWNTAYLPIISSDLYDRFGLPYNTSIVTDLTASVLNVTAYEEYSPIYLPISYIGAYTLGFAISTSVLVHTILYHGADILALLKRVSPEEEDIHAKLMRNYPEVPDWWYLGQLTFFAILAIIVVVKWDVQTPVWVLMLAVFTGAIYVLPGGYIYALTSQQITINILLEYMAGYLMPDKPLGNMIFKIFAAQVAILAMNFVQDLKLGHYQKIPPRVTFTVQLAACVWQSVVQVGVKRFIVGHVPDLCSPEQSAHLTCAMTRVFYGSSVVWGLIGPARLFGWKQLYNPILWALPIGAVLPIPFWLYSRRYPKSWVRFVNIPVAITAAMWVPPATGINFSSWFLVGFIFQFYLRRRFFRWWSKFNFILSGALDSGTVFSGFVIFLLLQLPKGGTLAVDWWGNSVFTKTDDWNGVPLLTPPAEGFGPSIW